MKKIVIGLLLLNIILGITSCEVNMYSNYTIINKGTVLMKGSNYKYSYLLSNNITLYSDSLYNIGDTLYIGR